MPGNPAPDTACRVTTEIRSKPKASASGLSASTKPIVEQFGLATMPAGSALPASGGGSSERWSGFTSGTSSGTSASMRCALAFVTTRQRRANRSSASLATPASRAENTMSSSPPDRLAPSISSSIVRTVMAATAGSIGRV